VLFFIEIEIETRRVHLAGITQNPTGSWVSQEARNLALAGTLDRLRFLISDRDSKFTSAFDTVFASEGIRVIQTPIRTPSRTPTRSASSAPSAQSASTGS
jgi:putative transposase